MKKTADDFMFSIGKYDMCGDMAIVVSINTKSCWSKRRCLTDHYTAEEQKFVESIATPRGLYELAESEYEYSGEKTMEELRDELIALGIEHNQDFQKFMDDPSCR